MTFASASWTTQDPARVAEIAAMLRPEAGFAEMRIGNRAAWEKIAKDDPKAVASVVREAAKLLEAPLPELDESTYLQTYTNTCATSSDVYPWWTSERLRASQMIRLVLAECYENRGRFLPRIVEILEKFVSVRTWVMPYHDPKARSFRGEIRMIELCGGIVSLAVSQTVDVLGDVLPPDLVARAKKAVRTNELETYLGMARDLSVGRKNGCMWVKPDYVWNWNAACNYYMVGSALCVLDDPMERAACIELAERLIVRYLAGFTRDGLSLEGPGYWSYGFGNYLRLGIEIRRATGGRDAFFDDFSEKAMASGFDIRYNDLNAPAYGDNGSKSPDPPPASVWFVGSLVWPRFACLPVKHLNRAWGGLDVVGYTRFPCPGVSPDRTYEKPYRYPLRSWFEDIAQQLVCRPFPGQTNALYAAFKGGHNGAGHNHNDIGTFTLAIDGRELVCDPGVKAYAVDTFGPDRYKSNIRNSYGHPVPLVDGTLQSDGAAFAAKLVSKSFSDDLDVVELDLSGAYRCAKLERLVRRFAYDRRAGAVTVTDRVKFATPGRFDSPIVTFGRVLPQGDGTYAIVSRDGKDRLSCRVTATGGRLAAMTCEQLEDTGVHQGSTRGRPNRCAFAFDAPVTEAGIEFRFDLRKSNPANE